VREGICGKKGFEECEGEWESVIRRILGLRERQKDE